MTKRTKLALLISSHALFAGGGTILGYFVHEEVNSSIAFVDEIALVSRVAAHVEIQRLNGSDKDYKEALMAYLEVLNNHIGTNGLFTERTNAIDKTLTLVRLARVSGMEGNGVEANAYAANAVASCASTGWEVCSKERLWWVVDMIDENLPQRRGSTESANDVP